MYERRDADELWCTAFHEAGHAVLACRVGFPTPLADVRIAGTRLGQVWWWPGSFRKTLEECAPSYARSRASREGVLTIAGPMAAAFAWARHERRGVAVKVHGRDLENLHKLATFCADRSASRWERHYYFSFAGRAAKYLNEPATYFAVRELASLLMVNEWTWSHEIERAVERGRRLATTEPTPVPCRIDCSGAPEEIAVIPQCRPPEVVEALLEAAGLRAAP